MPRSKTFDEFLDNVVSGTRDLLGIKTARKKKKRTGPVDHTRLPPPRAPRKPDPDLPDMERLRRQSAEVVMRNRSPNKR